MPNYIYNSYDHNLNYSHNHNQNNIKPKNSASNYNNELFRYDHMIYDGVSSLLVDLFDWVLLHL